MADPIQDLPGEIWKPVVGWESTYEVSNLGRIRTKTRVITFAGRWGPAKRFVIGRMVRQSIRARGGYCVITLNEFGRKANRFVHNIVLLAFVGPRPTTMECCHGDGNPRNNVLTNLRWDTHSANQADMVAHGRAAAGERNAGAKLTSANVAEIRQELEAGASTRELSKRFEVTQTAIRQIRSGKTWRHLLCLPNVK